MQNDNGIYTEVSGQPNNIYGYCISETTEERFIRSKFTLQSIEAVFIAIIEALKARRREIQNKQ